MRQLTLQNGIPVVLAPMNGTNVVTALVLFKVGSRNESASVNGISHFIEHLFFKGTENRPTTLDISRELDSVGADYNAFTSKDYTGYYVKAAKRHSALAIDILEDLLFHPLFDQAEIDRERGVIIEEMNMYEDSPMAISEELSEELMFGQHHPLGFRIIGTKEVIQSVTRKQIIKYRDEYYRSNNMVIILAGSIDSDARNALRTRFGSAHRAKQPIPKQRKFIYRQKSSRVHIKTKETAQSHLALTYPGPTYRAKELPAYELLSAIFGGTMSSRLFINVRERRGLCYYIRSHVSPYEDCGAFTIQAGFDTSRIRDALGAIIEQIADIAVSGVTDEELRKGKEYIRGKRTLRLEDSESVAAWWGKEALFRRHGMRSPSDYERAINAVSAQQLQKLARAMFQPTQANLAVIGPYPTRRAASFKKQLRYSL